MLQRIDLIIIQLSQLLSQAALLFVIVPNIKTFTLEIARNANICPHLRTYSEYW